MQRILIIITFGVCLVGINSDYYAHLCQKYPFLTTEIGQKAAANDLSKEHGSQYFIDCSTVHPIACEKPSFSLRLHSGFRVLIATVSFKETCIKHFFKNKIITSEIISNICLVKQLYAGYYTYGLGKIRF
ncbi:MAG: hypothetical protein LBH82_07120 [Bacteroidales bacterium]|jgi:hypothetical protein|nr:hypothetical protein [Bacteroidales bacterium]